MRSSAANGITLVEVVAALTLMGSLLTVILVSGSKHLRQLKAAEQKRVSVRKLDDFLATWSVSNFDPAQIPAAVQRSGMAATGQYGRHGIEESSAGTDEGFQVELQRVRDSELDGGAVLRLTVSAAHAQRGRTSTAWTEIMVPR